LFFVCFFLPLWYWSFNSGLRACEAAA
jgi:hypothetical protein